MSAFYYPDTNLVEVNALKNRLTQAYINDATVTVSIYNTSDTLLSGPTSLAYVAASNGNYAGYVASSGLTISVHQRLVAQFDITDGSGRISQLRRSLTVVNRA